jgi:hypothetical protein
LTPCVTIKKIQTDPVSSSWERTSTATAADAKDHLMTPIEELIPDYIRGLPVYVPGRPIEEVEQELKLHAIKLASNENPLGPSPKAIQAAKSALPESHRYPDGGTHHLREKLAQMHKLSPDGIFVGLGSSEIIDLAARLVLGPAKTGITPLTAASHSSGFMRIVCCGLNITGVVSGRTAHKPFHREFSFRGSVRQMDF